MLSFAACHGSPKTQNLKNAIALTQGSESLACGASKQMSTMWQHRSFARSLSVVRLLQGTTGPHHQRKVIRERGWQWCFSLTPAL
jgi:hypothetical protein